MSAPTVWLSCGVLRAEMEALHRQGKITGTLWFLDSMLHLAPQTLESTLSVVLEQPDRAPGCLVLVYGDCCPRMLDLVRQFRVGRVNAINCAQLLVGRRRYRELMRDRAFLLLPEWAARWKEIFETGLSLSPEVARDLMSEDRRELVYLDTGLVPVPQEALVECAAYTGLPWRTEPVPLDHLLSGLTEALAAAAVFPPQEISP